MIKQIVTGTLLLGCSMAAVADGDWMSKCTNIAGLAKSVMTKRQQGATMQDLMNIVHKNGGDALAEEIIIEAYDISAYNTDTYQSRAVNEFQNTWYLRCVKILRPK